MLITALSLSIGIGQHLGDYQDKYYDNPVGIVRVIQPINDRLTIQLTHNSSLENGFSVSNKDTNVLSIEYRIGD